MSNKVKHYVFYALGMVLCILPGVITILQLFPLWKERSFATLASGMTVSGLAVFLLVLTSTPLLKEFKSKIKTPSSWCMWLIGSVVCYAIGRVINDIALVCFVSFLGNVVGAVLFKIAEHYPTDSEEPEPEEETNGSDALDHPNNKERDGE